MAGTPPTRAVALLLVGSLLLASVSIGGTGGFLTDTAEFTGSFTAGNTESVTDITSGNDAPVTVEPSEQNRSHTNSSKNSDADTAPPTNSTTTMTTTEEQSG